MTVVDRTRSIFDLARAYGSARAGARRDRWRRSRIEALRQKRLDRIVDHARLQSPLYRERYAHLPGRPTLQDLPVITKQHVRERFDDMLADGSLNLEEVEAHAGALRQDAYLRGSYKVLTTSGTTGPKAFHVFDRREWSVLLSSLIRRRAMAGFGAGPLSRQKIAVINRDDARVTTRRLGMATSAGRGFRRVLQIPLGTPTSEIVAALNQFQPNVLSGYPSAVVELATEQEGGRLSIKPSALTCTSETISPEIRELTSRVWGVVPFDSYGLSEVGVIAAECRLHQGLHILEDQVLLESVDDDYRPVPHGVQGSRALLTSLFNFTQPLIRFEVDDLITLDDDPCPCGRSSLRIRSIEGRGDELLHLPRAGGKGHVVVHPGKIAALTKMVPDILEYQVARETPFRLRIALREGADAEVLIPRIQATLLDLFAESDASREMSVELEIVDRIDRNPVSGKMERTVRQR